MNQLKQYYKHFFLHLPQCAINFVKYHLSGYPKITVLTRTSERPNYFEVCLKSIRSQTYPNMAHIVSVDTDATERYVKAAGCRYIRLEKTPVKQLEDAPYNLYLNALLDEVSDGWILILDDDDHFISKTVLSEIALRIRSTDDFIRWRIRNESGRIIPSDKNFQNIPQAGDIAMNSFMFHSKWKDTIRFDNKKRGDYRFSYQLYMANSRKVYYDKILVQLGNDGLLGQASDL